MSHSRDLAQKAKDEVFKGRDEVEVIAAVEVRTRTSIKLISSPGKTSPQFCVRQSWCKLLLEAWPMSVSALSLTAILFSEASLPQARVSNHIFWQCFQGKGEG